MVVASFYSRQYFLQYCKNCTIVVHGVEINYIYEEKVMAICH